MNEFHTLTDGEGVELESNVPFRFACCDCGLVHDMVIVSEDGKPVGFAIKRMQEATRTRRIDMKIEYCDHCDSFLPWTSNKPIPDSYNPCIKGHKMQFRSPDEHNWTGEDWGFFRPRCADRSPTQPTEDGGAHG